MMAILWVLVMLLVIVVCYGTVQSYKVLDCPKGESEKRWKHMRRSDFASKISVALTIALTVALYAIMIFH